MEHSYLDNEMVKVFFNLIANQWYSDRCVWLGDYANFDEVSFYDVMEHYEEISLETAKRIDGFQGKYFVSEKAKEFVNMSKYVDAHEGHDAISPTLLLALGNGNGGGDYRGTDEHYVGRWACDSISLVEEPPTNFQEILPMYKESE
jgi:hypothetical protein